MCPFRLLRLAATRVRFAAPVIAWFTFFSPRKRDCRVCASSGSVKPNQVLRYACMANLDSCRGKWALVTGASSGIGWALAEKLAAGGAHLVLTARRKQRLAKLRRELRSAHGVKIEVLAADLGDPDAPQQIFAFTEERDITIDLLVNNAGVGSYGEFRNSEVECELGIVQVSQTPVFRVL